MPSFEYDSYLESPSLYIDFSRLPPPKVIEEIDYEDLVKIYLQRFVATLPAMERATKLQQSPTNVVLQTEAYGEMMVRARINTAARALMVPFARGSDLDVLGAFYGEQRQPLVPNPRSVDLFPGDWESDAEFRRRVQMSPEAFSTAGSEGAYIYHALKACALAGIPLRDASARRINERGGVRLSLMNKGDDPVATTAQIAAVRARITSKNIMPLTDTPSVVAAEIHYVDIDATLTLYEGPDQALVLKDVQTALTNLRARLALLGRDLTISALNSALYQEGVQNVKINSPNGDIVVGKEGAIWFRTVKIGIAKTRTE
jgi:phage-related baseplate assembly protein